MFLFHKQKRLKSEEPSECQIDLFGKLFTIKVINEMEATMDAPDGLVAQMIKKLHEFSSAIDNAIEEYINDNYFNIIKEYYLHLCYPSHKTQEYKEHLDLTHDYENNLCNHKDILIKNIRPIYYSVTATDSSYLFLYINDSDGCGVDVVLFPNLEIHKHDEIE